MKGKKNGVLVVGSANMDLTVRADRMPRPGETLLGRDFRSVPGGKGANQAVAAARMGARAALCGRVGEDAFGGELAGHLAAAGLDTSPLLRDGAAPTGVALIAVQPDGENAIIVAPGANHRVGPEDLQRARPWFEQAAVVLLQFELPLETVDMALDMAREHGCLCVLDPAPAVAAPAWLLAKADILTPNESEAQTLLKADIPGEEAAREAVSRFLGMGVKAVLLKLGERGALLGDGAGQRLFPAHRIAPVDTTAAGDAFTGALGAALAAGEEMERAVAMANAAGALACLAPGAQPSLPDREAVLAFLGEA